MTVNKEKTPQERKAKSIEFLKDQGVPVIEHLPPIEPAEDLRRRPADEIARRAVCSMLTIQVACDAMQGEDLEPSITFFKQLLERYGVADCLTDAEKAIFSGHFSEQEAIDATWRYESYWVLLWALGIVEELSYPSEPCDCSFAVEAVSKHADLESFLASTRLRSMEELMDQADLIYRYDWACVDARIKGKEAPAALDGGVVVERHKGFSWLLDFSGTDDWDSPEINT